MALDTISTRSRGLTGRGRNVKRTSAWFGGLFWWTMLIILLALGAVASWTFCIFAFSYPEKPLNYAVLQKFNKLEPLKKFSNANAPSNRSYVSRDLYDRFNEYEDPALQRTQWPAAAQLHREFLPGGTRLHHEHGGIVRDRGAAPAG